MTIIFESNPTVRTDPNNPISVVVSASDPNAEPFKDNFRLSTNSAIINLNVNPGGTPQLFVINPDSTKDILVTRIALLLKDAQLNDNELGSISGLTNPIEIFVEIDNTPDPGLTTRFFLQNAPTTEDLVEQSLNVPFTFSPTMGQNIAPENIFIFYTPDGVKLRTGTNDRLVTRINENISGLAKLRTICEGKLVDPS